MATLHDDTPAQRNKEPATHSDLGSPLGGGLGTVLWAILRTLRDRSGRMRAAGVG